MGMHACVICGRFAATHSYSYTCAGITDTSEHLKGITADGMVCLQRASRIRVSQPPHLFELIEIYALQIVNSASLGPICNMKTHF